LQASLELCSKGRNTGMISLPLLLLLLLLKSKFTPISRPS
jgi:hypothetical protein